MGWFDNKKLPLSIAALLLVIFLITAMKGPVRIPFLETAAVTVLSPFQYAFSSVGHGIHNTGSQVGDIWNVYDDNQQLKAEVEQLRQERSQLAEVQAEPEETAISGQLAIRASPSTNAKLTLRLNGALCSMLPLT